MIAVVGSLILIASYAAFQASLSGPQFIGAYLVLVAICWASVKFVYEKCGVLLAILAPSMTLMVVALVRVNYGMQVGHTRYGFLIAAFLLGVSLVLVRIYDSLGEKTPGPVICSFACAPFVAVWAVFGLVGALTTLGVVSLVVFQNVYGESSGLGGCGGGCGGGGCGGCGG